MKIKWTDSNTFVATGDEVEFSALACFVALVGNFGPKYPMQESICKDLLTGLQERQRIKFAQRDKQ